MRLLLSRTVFVRTLVVLGTVIAGLLVLVLLQQQSAIRAVERETAARSAADARIVQRTVDEISRVARAERLVACVNDEQTRAAARLILERFAIPSPIEFRARNCVRLADDYARRLRDAGPLTEGAP